MNGIVFFVVGIVFVVVGIVFDVVVVGSFCCCWYCF